MFHLASSFKFVKMLFVLPILAIIDTLLLFFLCFIFFQANDETEKNLICNQGQSAQDNECVVTKDGHQICGHSDIRKLCGEIELGFYLTFMGAILMAGTMVLFVTTACIRRSRLVTKTKNMYTYFRLAQTSDDV